MIPDNGFPSNAMFSLFPVLFFCIFAVVVIVIIVSVSKNIGQWAKNNNQPVLVVPAKLVSKRTNVSHHMHTDSDSFSHGHTSTYYYITFEVETGSRMEFHVNGSEYGLLAEGDSGRLKFQGTRYLGFERTV